MDTFHIEDKYRLIINSKDKINSSSTNTNYEIDLHGFWYKFNNKYNRFLIKLIDFQIYQNSSTAASAYIIYTIPLLCIDFHSSNNTWISGNSAPSLNNYIGSAHNLNINTTQANRGVIDSSGLNTNEIIINRSNYDNINIKIFSGNSTNGAGIDYLVDSNGDDIQEHIIVLDVIPIEDYYN